MFNTEYWDNRAIKYGHTGYSDPFYYCFDQTARLYAINKILKSHKFGRDSVLDFGCGSGDFLKLLAQHFKIIHGFDTSQKVVHIAQEKFKDSVVLVSADLKTLSYEKGYDVILSVTVLQSLSKDVLEKTISTLSKLLSMEGKIISMEFFSTEEYNLSSNEERVTHREWSNVLQNNGLKIIQSEGFYNPVLFPARSWKYYKMNLYVRALRLFKHKPFVQAQLRRIAQKLIERYADVYPYPTSTFKVYVIEKIK